MAITILGEQTKTIFLKGIENHKLHHEFEVGAAKTIKKGQPVKLMSNGTVEPAGVGEANNNIIGWSIHNGDEGELVTIGMRAMAIVWASPKLATVAGPVAYDGMNVTDKTLNSFKTLAPIDVDVYAANDLCGWLLDQTTDVDQVARVAIL